MARGPRGLARSRCVKSFGGKNVRFATRSRSYFAEYFAEIYDCSRWEQNAVFFPNHQAGAKAKTTRAVADNDFSSSALPSRRLDRRARHNPTARHPVDERSHGAQRPTSSPRFARERKTELPPAPNGDARLANDAAIGSRTSGRRSTPRFSHVKRRPARRDERPRAFVRAPRRRSVASPPARALLRGARDTRTTAGTTDRAIGSATARGLAATTIGAIAIGG